MLKIAVGVVLFAALAIFVILKGGSSLDVGAEMRNADTAHAPAEAASAPPADASSAR